MKIAGPVGRVAQLVNLVGPLVWSSALLVRSSRCPSDRYAARQFVTLPVRSLDCPSVRLFNSGVALEMILKNVCLFWKNVFSLVNTKLTFKLSVQVTQDF